MSRSLTWMPTARANARRDQQAASETEHHHIYVTHDQTEAMTMATRIVIIRMGLFSRSVRRKRSITNRRNVCCRIYWVTSNEFYSRHDRGDKFVTETLKLTIPEEKLAV